MGSVGIVMAACNIGRVARRMFDETLSFVAADIIAEAWTSQPVVYRRGFFQLMAGDYGDAGLTGHQMRWRPVPRALEVGGDVLQLPIPKCDHGYILCPCWETPWDDLPL